MNLFKQQDEYFEMRLEYMKDRMCLYRPFLRPAAAEALNSAVFGENFAGSTDPSALSLLVMFCAITQPVRMLELGTFHGFGTMTIAEILATNKRPGTLVTVEPLPEYQERAKEFISRAGLASTVHFVSGFSTDEAVLSVVEEQAPYDIIYIDSSHQYAKTLEELDLYLIERPLIRPGGLVFLHDITLELENDPGVGPAVDEWIKRHPEYHYLPLSTKGIWPQAAGFGIIQTPVL
jgi:predicted O-methyltransferase YrrM